MGAQDQQANSHQFQIEGYDCWFSVAFGTDGRPEEIFVVTSPRVRLLARGFLEQFKVGANAILSRGFGVQGVVSEFQNNAFAIKGAKENAKVDEVNEAVHNLCTWLEEKFPNGVWHEVPKPPVQTEEGHE